MKLVIVDDQRILAEGLKLLLSQESDIEVLAIGENGEEAIRLVGDYKPDVLLIDIQMPVMNGVEAIKHIKIKYPQVHCLILTTFSDDEYIFEGIKNGASGYLLKDASPKEIASALRVIHSGGALIQPNIAAKMLKQFTHLANQQDSKMPEELAVLADFTQREMEIVALVAKGLSNVEISEQLFLTEGTVKNNLTRILQKTELRDRTQLAIFWLKQHS